MRRIATLLLLALLPVAAAAQTASDLLGRLTADMARGIGPPAQAG